MMGRKKGGWVPGGQEEPQSEPAPQTLNPQGGGEGKRTGDPLLFGVGGERLRVGLGGAPREQNLLEGHIPKVMYHQVF